MILCVGEILADMIGSVKDDQTVYARKAGGAPFNVACAAKQFGAHSAFVGSVGDDLIGMFLEDLRVGAGWTSFSSAAIRSATRRSRSSSSMNTATAPSVSTARIRRTIICPRCRMSCWIGRISSMSVRSC